MKNKNTSSNKYLAFAGSLMLLSLAATLLAPLTYAADIIPDASKIVAAADTEMPSDVENVKAAAGDGEISLTWNVATDNIGVKGYKIYYGSKPVINDGDTYEKTLDVGNKIKYTVTALTNGTKYYFALTAYDAAGNESANYSLEASATPGHGAADTEAPKITKAESIYKDQVKLTFSEAVKIPAALPESAFSIKNDTTQALLQVKKVEMDKTDPSQKTVILTTGIQQAGASYLVTAGIQIKDLNGNPIVSGTSDTGLFTGTDIEHAAVQTQQQTQQQAAADTKAPELTNVKVLDPTTVEVTFSEPIVLSSDPTQNFIITEEKDYEKILNVKKVVLSTDQMKVTITTDAQQPMNYNLISVEVKDKAGNVVGIDNTATVFFGGLGGAPIVVPETPTQQTTTTTGPDMTPPEDVTNLFAKMVSQMVRLSWAGSANSAGDLANYILYQSTVADSFMDGTKVDPTAKNFDIKDLVPGMQYFFKLTSKDSAGNESPGVVTTYTLPATGPEMVLLLFGSFGLGKLLKKRKNNK
jgi:hypothetical protein